MAATLGVATFSYVPYAIFNFANPLLAIAVAYLGARAYTQGKKGHGAA